MKRLLLVAAAFTLPACTPTIATLGGLNQAITVNQDKVLVPATQALIVAHNAYQGAAAVATTAVQAGLIRGENLNRLQELNNRAKQLLDQADAGQNVAQNAAEVMNIVTDMRALAGR